MLTIQSYIDIFSTLIHNQYNIHKLYTKIDWINGCTYVENVIIRVEIEYDESVKCYTVQWEFDVDAFREKFTLSSLATHNNIVDFSFFKLAFEFYCKVLFFFF